MCVWLVVIVGGQGIAQTAQDKCNAVLLQRKGEYDNVVKELAAAREQLNAKVEEVKQMTVEQSAREAAVKDLQSKLATLEAAEAKKREEITAEKQLWEDRAKNVAKDLMQIKTAFAEKVRRAVTLWLGIWKSELNTRAYGGERWRRDSRSAIGKTDRERLRLRCGMHAAWLIRPRHDHVWRGCALNSGIVGGCAVGTHPHVPVFLLYRRRNSPRALSRSSELTHAWLSCSSHSTAKWKSAGH